MRVEPVSNDSVAKLPRLPHETRRLSDGHVDGVEAAWHSVDAIDATTSSSSSLSALSHGPPRWIARAMFSVPPFGTEYAQPGSKKRSRM